MTGSTQTDSLALERQRGITIKSAVVSFVVGDVTVNLIDTPGHPDFIAEVERVLSVLDGAVLVVSAVEGVQAQTRVLMRALRRLRIPTLIFVNKIDRGGARRRAGARGHRRAADPGDRRDGLGDAASARAAARSARTAPATPAFTAAAGRAARRARRRRCWPPTCATRPALSYRRLRRALAAQTRRALVHPVFFGSAITGAGVDELTAGHHRAAARRRAATRRARSRARCSRSSAARPGRRSPTSGCSPARCASGTGCRFGARRERQGHRDQRVRARRGGPARRGRAPGRSASSGAWRDVQIGDAIGVPRRGGAAPAPLRAADAGDRRRARAAARTRARCTPRSPSSPSRTR